MPDQSGTPPISFRSGDLLEPILIRATEASGLGVTAKRDLGRYYALIGEAKRTLSLSRNELCATMDACNGLHLVDDIRWRYLWADVADTPDLGDKWGIDRDALVAKLRAMTPLQLIALADAIEIFWAHTQSDTDDALRIAGVL